MKLALSFKTVFTLYLTIMHISAMEDKVDDKKEVAKEEMLKQLQVMVPMMMIKVSKIMRAARYDISILYRRVESLRYQLETLKEILTNKGSQVKPIKPVAKPSPNNNTMRIKASQNDKTTMNPNANNEQSTTKSTETNLVSAVRVQAEKEEIKPEMEAVLNDLNVLTDEAKRWRRGQDKTDNNILNDVHQGKYPYLKTLDQIQQMAMNKKK